MYWQILRFESKPDQREMLMQESRAHAEDSVREEPGTLAFYFLQDEEDKIRFYAVEHYTDREAHHFHAQGEVVKRNGPKVGPLLAGPPVLVVSGDQIYP
jgi:(4S)-4-hydroxy-5-phosphonooxypentane-2,3-dione isomerase